jgi:hypothetical protein
MIAPQVKTSAVTTGMVTSLTVTMVWASHNAIETSESEIASSIARWVRVGRGTVPSSQRCTR